MEKRWLFWSSQQESPTAALNYQDTWNGFIYIINNLDHGVLVRTNYRACYQNKAHNGSSDGLWPRHNSFTYTKKRRLNPHYLFMNLFKELFELLRRNLFSLSSRKGLGFFLKKRTQFVISSIIHSSPIPGAQVFYIDGSQNGKGGISRDSIKNWSTPN